MNYLSNGNPKIHGRFTVQEKGTKVSILASVAGWEMMSGHPIFLLPEGLRSLGEMLSKLESMTSKDGITTFDGYLEHDGFFTSSLDIPESADEKFKRRGF
jgi:hypothetical protein